MKRSPVYIALAVASLSILGLVYLGSTSSEWDPIPPEKRTYFDGTFWYDAEAVAFQPRDLLPGEHVCGSWEEKNLHIVTEQGETIRPRSYQQHELIRLRRTVRSGDRSVFMLSPKEQAEIAEQRRRFDTRRMQAEREIGCKTYSETQTGGFLFAWIDNRCHRYENNQFVAVPIEEYLKVVNR